MGLLDLTFITERDHPSDSQSLQHHCGLLAPVLGAAAAPGLYWISNFEGLHASPMVAIQLCDEPKISANP